AACYRCLARVGDRFAPTLWAGGAAAPPPGPWPCAEAALAAWTAAALCASGQDRAAPAPRARQSPRRLRDAGGGAAGAGSLRLADQYVVCRAAQPEHPPACRGGGTAGQYPVQGRGRLRPAAVLVPLLLQLLLASCQ